jgi:hypothetical protein
MTTPGNAFSFIAQGWQKILHYRFLLLVILAIALFNSFTQGFSNNENTVNTGSMHPPLKTKQHLLEPWDGTNLIAQVPQIYLRVPGRTLTQWHLTLSPRAGVTVIIWELIIGSALALWTGIFVALMSNIVCSGRPAWNTLLKTTGITFFRYFVLMTVLAILETVLSIHVSNPSHRASRQSVFVLWTMLASLKYLVVFVPFIITIENVSLLRAIWLSLKTGIKYMHSSLKIALGIGSLQYLLTGPFARFMSIAWHPKFGHVELVIVNSLISLICWIIYIGLGTWFCLSAISWWLSIRDLITTKAVAGQSISNNTQGIAFKRFVN